MEPNFKVGDKVRVKTLEQLKTLPSYISDEKNHVEFKTNSIKGPMVYYMSSLLTVQRVYSSVLITSECPFVWESEWMELVHRPEIGAKSIIEAEDFIYKEIWKGFEITNE